MVLLLMQYVFATGRYSCNIGGICEIVGVLIIVLVLVVVEVVVVVVVVEVIEGVILVWQQHQQQQE